MPRRRSRAARCSSTTPQVTPQRRTGSLRRRYSMARRRASMREGPLAELFRATEAAQQQADKGGTEAKAPPENREPLEETVEHVPEFMQEEPAPIAAVPEAE